MSATATPQPAHLFLSQMYEIAEAPLLLVFKRFSPNYTLTPSHKLYPYVPRYASLNKKMSEKEKVSAYIKERLETGRMAEAMDIAKVTGTPLSEAELKNYIHKYLENGWMSRAVEGARAAGIELKKEVLAGYIEKYLERGKIYSAFEASKIIGMPLPEDKLVTLGREALLKGKLNPGLEAYALVEKTPPEEELVICGSKCFTEGQLYPGLEAYKKANKTPPEEELMICGSKCLGEGKTTPGLEAYRMANKTPTKEMLRACGEMCLIGKRHDDARKAFVAAQKIEEETTKPIEIREISPGELSDALGELNFGAKACLSCKNEVFKERYFIISRCPESREEEEWLDKAMKKQYGVGHFCVVVDVFEDDRGLIDSAVCSECGSQDVLFE